MGIKSLFKIMEKPSETPLSKMAGKRVAVDVSILICRAEAVNISPTRYVASQMLMLKECDIVPVIVFDGQSPEAKRECREARKLIRDKKAEQGNDGDVEESPLYSGRNSVIQNQLKTFCSNYKIEFVQSPCEADAQIAYLVIKGFVDFALTEDSDFLVFGCPQVMFKLQKKNGLLYDQRTIERSLGAPFNLECFRSICICLGCDYLLKGLPNFGPAAAKTIYKDLASDYSYEKMILCISKMGRIKGIPADFEENFIRAVNTFRYQLVLDPTTMQIVPMTPYDDGKTSLDYPYAGLLEQTQESADWIQNRTVGKSNLAEIKEVISKNRLCCMICNESFPSLPFLSAHYREKHPVLCDDCGQAFTSSLRLKLHRETHNQARLHSCHKCQKDFKRLVDLKAHWKRNPQCDRERENRTCEKCGKTFALPCHLKKHAVRCQPKQVDKTCRRCGKSFSSGTALRIHLERVDCQRQIKPFHCEKCGQGFTLSANFRKHLLKATCQPPDDTGVWKCKTCGKGFALNQSLTHHLNKGNCLPVGEKKTYSCSECGKVLSGPREVKRHMGSTNCQNRQKLQADDKPYKCVQCGKAFKTRQICQRHETGCQLPNESEIWRYNCPHCDKGYNRLGNMKGHLKKCTSKPTGDVSNPTSEC